VTDSKAKILLTASTFPRWDSDTEPEFILQLATALSKYYQVTVLAPHCAGAARQETIGPVTVRRYRYAPTALQSLAYGGGIMANLRARPWRWLLVPGLLLSQLYSMWSICRESKIALLHVHWIIPQGLALLLGKILGWRPPPVLLTSHGADLFALRSAPLRWLKRQILQQADQVNVVSHAMLDECEALGLHRDAVIVRSMGVDLQHRFTATTPWQERSGLVFVGRLVEKKGVDVLIKAFARLQTDHPEITLTIIGDGPLRSELEALSAALGCSGAITFKGAVPNDTIPAVLNQHRIAVVPSVIASDGDQEGLGLVAVEAMGCGCAVVSSDIGALKDVITNRKTGLMVPTGDCVELAQGLGQLLQEQEKTQGIADVGRANVRERFDWPRVARDYSRFYIELMR
jgi:glycosyltransferase involved in cell wall biosynthesis